MATARIRVAPPQRSWSTLRLLKAARSGILFLNAVLLIAIVGAAEAHRAALRTIGQDIAPGMIAAQHIKSAMADMDADAADGLLAGPGGSPASLQAYETRRVEAARALIAAAGNITYGDAERMPIQTVQVGLGSYERLVQRARDLRERGDPGAVAAYREAAGVLDTVLLPAADALDKAKNDALEQTYRSETFRSSGSRFVVVLLAVSTFGSLLMAQMILSRRMHRTFNPLLLAATLVVLGWTVFALRAVSRSHESLKVAEEDAFTSVHVLWRARATAYAAKGEESRYLLDTAHAAEYQQRFLADAGAVASSPAGLDNAQMTAALRERRSVDGFSGYLAEEFNNVTFPGERDAALEMLEAWQRYLAVDTQMRQLERTGQHRRAVDFGAGSGAGQSDSAFQQFDGALERTLSINQAAFTDAVTQGYAELGSLEWETGAAALLAGILVVAGFAPRIREYR